MLRIKFTSHARVQISERGVSESEVAETLQLGDLVDARLPRVGRRRVFTEGYERENRVYPHKEVTVIYVEEGINTVIVTVFARYGRWEGSP